MTECITHPQHLTTQLPTPPVESNHIGPCHFSFSCAPTQAFITQSSPAASNASSLLDLVSPKPTIPDVPPWNGPRMPRSEAWKEVVRHWWEGAPKLNLPIPLKDWPSDYIRGPNRHLQSKYNQWCIIATEYLNRWASLKPSLFAMWFTHLLRYGDDEAAFTRVYNVKKGIKALLEAIKTARQEQGDMEIWCCCSEWQLVLFSFQFHIYPHLLLPRL